MKTSYPLLIVLGVTFGLCQTAKSNTAQKLYKVDNCDCITEKNGIPTFLSDYEQGVEISARGKSLVEAEKKANRICRREFKNFKKTYAAGATVTGCRKKISRQDHSRWKEI